ncbi:MAG: acetyl-CoA carboxylase carboxyltransferase subunit alpha [Candidatus Omnitrophica bacterium]|nr:acetyl-CoA carboxylase carboxyltransferase subunit alpha [Candidatus Omnitrophota bacterium]MDD5236376.1 acetyl-CoA carboxylase carboxyltransferase subunit alpha [Candidatus Omnitrophota bacterium]MDD5611238.1 acetyl-CoA carboxylase carboxyltransferase subunit alpha [Candidatus Omnitrophota bacterium]
MKGLDFERPISELEKKIEELKHFTSDKKIDLSSEIKRLEEKLDKLRKETYQGLTPWQRVQIARHPNRPYTLDYVSMIMTDFLELHGDRAFADDKALVAGLAKIDDLKIMVMGQQKGRSTQENIFRNFGCAHPEGYRKALRLMYLAQRANLPILCLIDTPGAYPGLGAEERGQAQAIATNLKEMANINVPIFCCVIGEGGSGGALGIGIGDRVAILENAYYSVISPEGCAAILWKDSTRAPEAAAALHLTGKELLEMGMVEEIIPEPLGGAHRDPQRMASTLKESILRNFKELKDCPAEKRLKLRYEKFRKIGVFA